MNGIIGLSLSVLFIIFTGGIILTSIVVEQNMETYKSYNCSMLYDFDYNDNQCNALSTVYYEKYNNITNNFDYETKTVILEYPPFVEKFLSTSKDTCIDWYNKYSNSSFICHIKKINTKCSCPTGYINKSLIIEYIIGLSVSTFMLVVLLCVILYILFF